ncbi:hypothetical protein BD769DRAFT_1395730 [Suillus cothurnatus]|nr:hypothetical protein BD769DRAFT_1395730 [Suillus cothurnatus]
MSRLKAFLSTVISQSNAKVVAPRRGIYLLPLYLEACRSWYNGIKEELKHVERELKNLSPELKKVRATNVADSNGTDPEDDVPASFCSKIGVDNIREFEERQLKVTEESQA